MMKFYISSCLLVALVVTSNALPGIIQMRMNSESKGVHRQNAVVPPAEEHINPAKPTNIQEEELTPVTVLSPKKEIPHSGDITGSDNYFAYPKENFDGQHGLFKDDIQREEQHLYHHKESIPGEAFGLKEEIPQADDVTGSDNYLAYPVENFDGLYEDDRPTEERHFYHDEESIPVEAFGPTEDVPHPTDIGEPYYHSVYPIQRFDDSDGSVERDIQPEQEHVYPDELFAIPEKKQIQEEIFGPKEEFPHPLDELGLDLDFIPPLEMTGHPVDSFDFNTGDIQPAEEYMHHDGAQPPVRVFDSEEGLLRPADVTDYDFNYPMETTNVHEGEYGNMREYEMEPDLHNDPGLIHPYEEFVHQHEIIDRLLYEIHHPWTRVQRVPEIEPERMIADHHLRNFRNRAKRGAQLLYPLGTGLLVKGLKAVRHLTRGTREVFSAGNIQEYEKAGGFYKALSDFHSVRPTKVKEFKKPDGVFGIKGLVGDRKIVLTSSNADGMPLIEITKIRNLNTRVKGQIQDPPEVLTTERIVYNRKIPTNDNDYYK